MWQSIGPRPIHLVLAMVMTLDVIRTWRKDSIDSGTFWHCMAMILGVNQTWRKDSIDACTGDDSGRQLHIVKEPYRLWHWRSDFVSDNVHSDFVSWLLDISRQVDHEGHTHTKAKLASS